MSNVLEFPRKAVTQSPSSIHAEWTFAAFDGVFRQFAPDMTLDVRLAAYDQWRAAIETAMRMAAEQMTHEAIRVLNDVSRTADIWDWLSYGDSGPELGKPTPRDAAADAHNANIDAVLEAMNEAGIDMEEQLFGDQYVPVNGDAS